MPRFGVARLGVMRLNAARLNVYNPFYWFSINTLDRTKDLRIAGASVQHQLNHAPDTATFRVDGVAPVAGQPVTLYMGGFALEQQLFAGYILDVTAVYETDRPQNVAWDIHCIDPTWLLNRRKILATFQNLSATDIFRQILAAWTTNFTGIHIAGGLPVIDEITFTYEEVGDAFTRICERIGAYWYVDYSRDLHVFYDEGVNAATITQTQPRGSRNHELQEDLSQIVTYIIGRGGGGTTVADAVPGQTEILVDDPSWYTAGGLVEVGTQAIAYTGSRGDGGAGAVTGIGSGPGNSPTVGLRNGATHIVGATYRYAYTYTTSSGESLPGPTSSVVISGAAPNRPPAPTMRSGYYKANAWNRLTIGGQYRWKIVYRTEGGGVISGGPSGTYTGDDKYWEIRIGNYTYSPAGYPYFPEWGDPGVPVSRWELYRTVAGGNTFYFDGVSISFVVGTSDGWYANYYQFIDTDLLQQPIVPADSASMGSVNITYVPTGGTSVTGRKVYRTPANGSQLKLLRTIANNTDVGPYADTTADAALGADVPTFDNSGLGGAQDIPIGSTDLPVSNTAPFTADSAGAGGWANVGNLFVRYSGIAGGKLTGIPPSGLGSISAPIRYGSQVLVQPRLVGISGAGIANPIKTGDAVTLRYDEQDLAAALWLAERLKITTPVVTSDGIVVDTISDGRMGLTELTAQVRATLKDRKDPTLTLTFQTRDDTVQIGRTITINLTSPPIAGTFRIQRITFSELAIAGARTTIRPLRTVQATNKLFAFPDLLRQIRSAINRGGN